MRDTDCIAFLRGTLPAIGLEWRGFRRVHRQVCKRLGRRLAALGLADLQAYRVYLGADAAEWSRLDELCRISITRFYRDRAVFDALRERLLPALAQRARRGGAPALRAWSAGCAGGEEPYTLALLWHLDVAPRFRLPRSRAGARNHRHRRRPARAGTRAARPTTQRR